MPIRFTFIVRAKSSNEQGPVIIVLILVRRAVYQIGSLKYDGDCTIDRVLTSKIIKNFVFYYNNTHSDMDS